MGKEKINKPFFIFNPKSYLYGEELLKMAQIAEKEAKKYSNISIFVTAPYADIKNISDNTQNIIITAQHIGSIQPGRGMGDVLANSIYEAGAKATFLNHAEKPLTIKELIKAIEIADKLGIITIVCADTLSEAKLIAHLKPDIILCEPSELIGTGQTSDYDYISETTKAIKEIDSDILVMQAAGISTSEDVYKTILSGADGTGCTSGIIKAHDPEKMLIDMIKAIEIADTKKDII